MAKLTKARIAAALRRAGRQRGVGQAAADLDEALRRPQLRQSPLVEDAMGAQALALLATFDVECASVDHRRATAEAFAQHHDYDVITSFPGLGDVTGARILGELGDDRERTVAAQPRNAAPSPDGCSPWAAEAGKGL